MEQYIVFDLGNNSVFQLDSFDEDDLTLADNEESILIDVFDMTQYKDGNWEPIAKLLK